ncbi:fasciclin domain-containing protein [Nodularia sp. UHCC 0506]|uniref:fasciclin domain-containing protein n=1 Tax=Nodularia sp. UHCC 0506 TaxID=3110243 RepID=UPI002B21EE2F|nr:fasciclin domain-containing protein [Nodularia sp. UHCC 0506]MEA5513262.1 fasciclin domain-containing protein [Nodularia sp. UHCC 0506]
MADIVETAINAGKFKTLVQAATTAQIIEILKSPGSVTLFAPTDDAFAELPKDIFDSLLQDIPKLKKILMYHVAFGDVRFEDLQQIEEATTLEGSVVAIDSDQGVIKVNDAHVLVTDIIADNGVIHAIDQVLMPAMVAGG